jgi:hypothetical protein
MQHYVLFLAVLFSSGAACGGVPDEGNHSSTAGQARFARKLVADSNEVSAPYRSIEHERAVLRKRVVEYYQQGKLSFEDYMRFNAEIEALDNWEVAREQAWTDPPSQTGDLADDSNEAGSCERYLPDDDRGEELQFDQDRVLIDSIGRPFRSRIVWSGPPLAASRDYPCQVEVGKWGILGDEGGHMVGSALGGYGGRANLVPQNRTLNRGLWNKTEQEIGRCMSAGYITTYTVLNQYRWLSSTVRPYQFLVSATVAEKKCFGLICLPIIFHSDFVYIPNEVPNSETAVTVTAFNLGFAAACSLSCPPVRNADGTCLTP